MMLHHLLRRPAILAALLLLLSGAPATAAGRSDQVPVSGKAVPQLRQLDAVVLQILRESNIPGASLAVARNGRLVFARGYGWADREANKPMQPRSRFNLASCSKPITASAILKLVDDGKLRLDDRAFVLLGDLQLPSGARVDPRARTITLRQLLHHSGGVPRDSGEHRAIARQLQVEPPLTLSQVVAFGFSRPLLFDPGTEAKYSNLGFLMLRAVVARVSGQDYETFTAEHVLAPMGIRDAHLDLMEGYHPNEVHRYLPGGKAHRGGHGDLKDGCGCWVLSPTDSMRFMTSLEGSRRPRVISQQAYVQMLAALPSLGVKRSGRHNGLGWDVVEPAPGGILYRKNGGVAGISTWMEHLPGDVCWALFFNARARDAMGEEGEDQPRKGTRKPPWARIREVLQSVERWPAIDLFESE